MTSPHGERSISNSNDHSYYENPAKGLDQSITLPSTLSSSSSNNKMCEDGQQGQLGAINVAQCCDERRKEVLEKKWKLHDEGRSSDLFI